MESVGKSLLRTHPHLVGTGPFIVGHLRLQLIDHIVKKEVHPFDFSTHARGDVWTLIGFAIYLNDTELVRVMLERVGDINEQWCHWGIDYTRGSCLEVAMENAHVESRSYAILRLLFDHGVDPFRPFRLMYTDLSTTNSNTREENYLRWAAYQRWFDAVFCIIDHFIPPIAEVEVVMNILLETDNYDDEEARFAIQECQLYICAMLAKQDACRALVWCCAEIRTGWQDLIEIVGDRFQCDTDINRWICDDETETRSVRRARKRHRTDMDKPDLVYAIYSD